jgi:predicted HicB family RNase H-like nuclease
MSLTGRINAHIDKDLYTEVKIHAAKTDQSVTAIIERALREYLKNQPIN